MIENKFLIWDENKNILPQTKSYNQEENDKCDITSETNLKLEKEISNRIIQKNSGIYKIIHKESGKYYVGSAVNFNKRWNAHKRDLIKNKHSNVYLQHAWNKYGNNSFEFIIVEYVDDVFGRHNNKLLNTEQKYLDLAKSDKSLNIDSHYNICYDANSPNLGRKCSKETIDKISNLSKNRKVSKETKKLLSDLAKIRYKDKNERKKISDSLKGHKLSNVTKEKIKLARKKQVFSQETRKLWSNNRTGVKNPSYDSTVYKWYNKKTGELIECSRYELIKKYNLNNSGISMLINNRLKQFKKWSVLK